VKDEGEAMKSKIVTAVLALIVLFQFAVIYSDKQIIRKMAQDHVDQQVRERIEGYDRCVAPLDEAHFTNHSDQAIWLKARQGCRDFWFQSGGAETRKP
jgi:hypothetical protein